VAAERVAELARVPMGEEARMGSLNPGGFSYVAELARVPIGGGGVRWAGDLNPGGFSYVAELAKSSDEGW